jgi:hypothetical protein
METIIAWQGLGEVIDPSYPKSEGAGLCAQRD